MLGIKEHNKSQSQYKLVTGMVVQHGEYSQLFCNTFYVDSNHTRGGEDIIIWLTVEPLCYTFETNIKLYINGISIKKLP